MSTFGIMLESMLSISPDTFPIVEEVESAEEIESVDTLNSRVDKRLPKSTHEATLIGSLKTYRITLDNKDEIGGVYRFDEK